MPGNSIRNNNKGKQFLQNKLKQEDKYTRRPADIWGATNIRACHPERQSPIIRIRIKRKKRYPKERRKKKV